MLVQIIPKGNGGVWPEAWHRRMRAAGLVAQLGTLPAFFYEVTMLDGHGDGDG